MIAITSAHDRPVRWLDPAAGDDQLIAFDRRLGFVGEAARAARLKQRREAGAAVDESEAPLFRFRVTGGAEAWRIVPLAGCRLGEGGDELLTPIGAFRLRLAGAGETAPVALPAERGPTRAPWWWAAGSLLALTVLLFTLSRPGEEEIRPTAEKEAVAPVVIQLEVPKPVEKEAPPRETAVDKQARARRAVSQQLGFLGTLGKKDLSKAAAGPPSEAARTTAGAGEGGDAGSGGEMLAGMGRGLHQASVGNSGVEGLGGIGKQGAGGGAGGYGDTSFGGAAGAGFSMPLDRDAVVAEGLDRSQIQAAIMRYLAQVRACYEEGLKRNAALIGQVVMAFDIQAAGQVGAARVQRSSLGDRPVEDCISGKMLNWKFPRPRGGRTVKVSYPFMLRPVKS